MSLLEEKTLSSEVCYEGKLLTVVRDEVLLPNGRTSIREAIRQSEAVGIAAVLEDKKMLFVRQYRYALKRTILEIPAGKLDPGEEPIHCAFRELQEETGYVASSMDFLTSFYTSPGSTNGRLHLYWAEGLTLGKVNPDEDEFVELVLLDADQVQEAITNGDICDAKTLMAVQLWKAQKGK